MFINCKSIESICLPKRLRKINSYAFDCCTSLSAIDIPANVEMIDDYAIYRCHNLEKITASKNGKRYYAKGNCLIDKKSETIILGCQASIIPTDEEVKYIGSSAFYAINNLRSIVIPSNILEIGDGSFFRCYELENVTLSEGLKKIGSQAFGSCVKLTKPNIPTSVISIEDDAFRKINPDIPAIYVTMPDGSKMYLNKSDDADLEEPWLDGL